MNLIFRESLSDLENKKEKKEITPVFTLCLCLAPSVASRRVLHSKHVLVTLVCELFYRGINCYYCTLLLVCPIVLLCPG